MSRVERIARIEANSRIDMARRIAAEKTYLSLVRELRNARENAYDSGERSRR